MQYSAGNIRKREIRGKWTWQAVVFATDADGKRRTFTKMTGVACDPPTPEEKGRGTKVQPKGRGAAKATAALKDWRDGLIAQQHAQNSSETLSEPQPHDLNVADYVETRYLPSRTLEPETSYASELKHIRHETLDMSISKLDVIHVNNWLHAMRSEGVGNAMQAKTFQLLRSACSYACDEGVLNKNPCLRRNAPKAEAREKNPLSEDTLKDLIPRLESLRESKPELADIARIALATGMRLGEICALKYDDVDDNMIYVRHALARNGGKLRLKDYPKNHQQREIPQNDVTREIIQTRRDLVLKLWDSTDGLYIFARPDKAETWPSSAYIGKQWTMYASMLDLRGLSGERAHFHDLRHTFATHALANDIDIITVSAILGHASPKTTLDYYARWMPNTKLAAMKKMANITGNSSVTSDNINSH